MYARQTQEFSFELPKSISLTTIQQTKKRRMWLMSSHRPNHCSQSASRTSVPAFVQRGINYDDLKIPCYHCDDESEVEWEFTDSDGDKHTMWAECPCCGGSGSIPNGTNHYLEIGECTISAYFMLLLYRTMVELGIDKVNVSKGNRQQFLFEIADGIDVLVMPCILANKRVKGITKIKTTKV